LGVYDAGGHAEVRSHVGFGLHVDILGTVETGRATGTDAVGAQGLYGLFFEDIAREEVVEVVGCEVGNSTAVGEFGLGA
jgi:hypothetical protein